MPVQILLAVVVPAVFGAICGWLLGINKTAYLVLSVLALLGGYAAGTEHKGGAGGALRGVIGGSLFGGLILIVNEALGKTPKATLPHPKIWLLAITVGVGVILGTLGGRARASFNEEEREKEKPAFDIRRIQRSELIGFFGAAILFLSLFLSWFATSCSTSAAAHAALKADAAGKPTACNGFSELHAKFGSFTAFQTYSLLDILLVGACAAPFILAYIIARGHDLTWRPGEITMIVGITAFALILVNGIILGRPGGDDSHKVDISISIGYWVGLVGSACIAFGGFVRQAQGIRGRKPPGVL